jgi:hypothetical protein
VWNKSWFSGFGFPLLFFMVNCRILWAKKAVSTWTPKFSTNKIFNAYWLGHDSSGINSRQAYMQILFFHSRHIRKRSKTELVLGQMKFKMCPALWNVNRVRTPMLKMCRDKAIERLRDRQNEENIYHANFAENKIISIANKLQKLPCWCNHHHHHHQRVLGLESKLEIFNFRHQYTEGISQQILFALIWFASTWQSVFILSLAFHHLNF